MPPAAAALDIGVGPCWGETCGDMLEAMAGIASRRNRTISLDPISAGSEFRERFFRRRFKFVLEGLNRFKRELGGDKR